MRTFDAAIVGAGHNGLVCAAALALGGMRVIVLENRGVVGGACRTERVFRCAPDLGCSTGAYLLGPMPPEVLEGAGLRGRVEILPRRPHGYFWLEDGSPAAFGVDGVDGGGGGLGHVSPADRAGLGALDAVIGAIRDDLAPLWLREACTLEESVGMVRERPVGPGAVRGGGMGPREAYRMLALGGDGRGGSVHDFVEKFGLKSEALAAVVATDGLVGSARGARQAGTGMNFLAHAMLRLPAGDSGWFGKNSEEARLGEPRHPGPLGAWQLVRGGMGAVTGALADVVREHGGEIHTDACVRGVVIEDGRAVGVDVDGMGMVRAGAVVLATDPRHAAALAGGAGALGGAVTARLAAIGARECAGTSLKVNMALRGAGKGVDGLPRVAREDALAGVLRGRSALTGTVHVLPVGATFERLERARQHAVVDGVAPDPDDCMIDVYTHTAVDASLRDGEGGTGGKGRHAMSLFVQWVPNTMTREEGEAFAWALIRGPVARVIPELPGLVEEIMVLTPRGIEERFGITGGHIHHIDNALAFDRRLPCRTGVRGLFLAGAGCHPAGSVMGAAGWIAGQIIRESTVPTTGL